MGIDGKYGQVTTEFGNISDDEPVVVFRAQDKLLPALLEEYMMLCKDAGSPQHHIDRIKKTFAEVWHWQQENHTQIPNSNTYVERISQE
jgi:hypothetical protein